MLRQPCIEGFSNLFRLTDPAALDNYIVEFLKLGKADQFFKEISAESTADAAILESDDLFLGLGKAMGLFDERGVDVDTKRVSLLVTSERKKRGKLTLRCH